MYTALRFTLPLLSLSLMACSSTDPLGSAADPNGSPAANPYAGGAVHPWTDVLQPLALSAFTSGPLSDQPWAAASSGWGPVERDTSNGEAAAGDGHALRLGGKTYPKGLGVHAPSTLRYALNAADRCTAFSAVAGLDDEVQTQQKYGSVTFQVWLDGALAWTSKPASVPGHTAPEAVSVPLSGKTSLELRVTDSGDGNWYDHADWADAKLSCGAVGSPAAALLARPLSGSAIELSWTGGRADLERSEAGGAYAVVARVAASPYTDSTLRAGVTYSYRRAGSATAVRQSTYAPPIVIEKGGTYSGDWESLNAGTPAVTVKTDEPVVIENSYLRSRGRIINVPWNHSELIVRGVHARGLNPEVRGEFQGRFIQTYNSDALTVEHNSVEGTMGIHVNTYAGNRSPAQSIKVRYNTVHNVMAQASDGQGGYLQGNTKLVDWDFGNFVQLYDVRNLPGIEIAWNQVINEPYKSRVEDVINFCRSGRASGSPALVHDNYIQGGTPYPNPYASYTGAGINAGDCPDGSGFGFVKVYGNSVVGFSGGGVGAGTGHDQEVYNNRAVSAGKVREQDPVGLGGIGLSLWNTYDPPNRADKNRWFYNDTVHDNVVGVMRYNDGYTYRCDGWWPEESKQADGGDVWCKGGFHNNVSLPDPVTLATERNEFALWQTKLAGSGMVLGAQP